MLGLGLLFQYSADRSEQLVAVAATAVHYANIGLAGVHIRWRDHQPGTVWLHVKPPLLHIGLVLVSMTR